MAVNRITEVEEDEDATDAALLELAQRAADCPTGDELKSYPDDYVCENKIYGLNPLVRLPCGPWLTSLGRVYLSSPTLTSRHRHLRA